MPLREAALELLRDQIVDGPRRRRGHLRQEQRELGTLRPAALVLRDLRGGVADRDQHREHLGRALRLGGAHRQERVEERAVQAEVTGRDEVAEVIEHGADLSARGCLVGASE